MLNLLFHPGPLFYFANLAVFFQISVMLMYGKSFQLGWVSCFLMGSWGVVNLFNLIPWYAQEKEPAKEKVGIRIHFQKMAIFSAYLLFVIFMLRLVGVFEWFFLPFVMLFALMHYIGVVLLSFHFRDKTSLRPGYFVRGFYLQEEKILMKPNHYPS